MSEPVEQASVEQVFVAIRDGVLSADELTTRKIAKFLGKTTSVLYHHWGCLDGLLFSVSQRGFAELRDRLRSRLDGGLPSLAEGYVEFGLDHPGLYELMLERRYEWDALRASGAFEGPTPGMDLLHEVVTGLAQAGSTTADTDARLLFAGLHGLVSLAQSGRANVGALSHTDRQLALWAAAELARRLCSSMNEHG